MAKIGRIKKNKLEENLRKRIERAAKKLAKKLERHNG